MTCRRLEDRDSLAELLEEPDRHTQQCPDCSARLRGYQRIASWIAEGKTSHRAPADWRRRTLAQLRAAASAGAAPSPSPQRAARAPSPLVVAKRPDPTIIRALPSSAPPRKARLVAAFALASAAIVVVTLIAVMTRGDGSAVQIAIGTEPRRSAPPDNAPPPAASPPAASPPLPAAPSIPPSSEPSTQPTVGQRRGVRVTIDIPSSDPATPVQPTIAVSIDTTPPGARVLLGGAILGTTPYRGTLPRSERQLKLAISLADFRDEVITVDASQPIARHIQLVPIPRNR